MTAVDLFAGYGGFSTAAELAGVKVLWAANHDQTAVRFHKLNHPNTDHVCQDLRQADWSKVPDHDICMASPSCQGHTRARGKERMHHDASRATAWAVIDCVEVKQPNFLIVENVPEFRKWRHFPRWRECLEEDYHLTENILDAADCGVPQNRLRLFMVGVHKKISKFPITITQRKMPHTPASTIIDWNSGNWMSVNKPGRAASTLSRVAQGKVQFGSEPFLMAYYGATKGGRSLERPIGSITTKDRYALIDGNRMRMLTKHEYKRAMGFPEKCILPENHVAAVKLLGNAVSPPCGQFLINQIKKAVPNYK